LLKLMWLGMDLGRGFWPLHRQMFAVLEKTKSAIRKGCEAICLSPLAAFLYFIGLELTCEKKRGLYRIDWYRPRPSTSLRVKKTFMPSGDETHYSAASLGLYSRMSSKNILPEPPGTVILPWVPRPIAILSTLVRFMP